MKKSIFQISIVAALFLGLFMTVTGCKKPQDTIAKIIVLDADNKTVSGAQVAIFGESTTGNQSKVNVGDTTTSNAAGEAIFNLNNLWKRGQAGVAVLNIEASKGSLTGSGVIKVEEETTSTETVFIQ
jgi:hypothetical protein